MQSPTGGDQLRRSKCRGPEASEGSSEGRSPRPRLMTPPRTEVGTVSRPARGEARFPCHGGGLEAQMTPMFGS